MPESLLKKLVLCLGLGFYVGLYTFKSFGEQTASAIITSAADLIKQIRLERSPTQPWRVDFNFNSLFSISNSVAAKLQSSTSDPNRQKNLTLQLEKIAKGEIPSQTTEIRTGSVTFADEQIRVDDRLVSMTPVRHDTASVSNKVIIITKEKYAKLYSYFGKQEGSVLGEAEMRSLGSNTSGLPLSLIPIELAKFIDSLTNTSIDQSAVDGIGCYRLKGNVATGCMGDCEMDFDPEKQMFPFRITLFQCDGMLSEYRIVWG